MSLLFDVFNAITGSREAPSVHHMPALVRLVLLAMANRADNASAIFDRGIACIEADTSLGAVTVRRCIADALAKGWLIERGWKGPRNNAVRLLEVRTEGKPWEPSDARDREPPPARRKRLAAGPHTGCEPGLTPETGPTPDVSPASHAAIDRPHTRREGGLTPGDDLPPSLPPSDLPFDRPFAPVRAHAGPIPGSQQVSIPGVDAGEGKPAERPAKDPPKTREPKASKPPREKTAGEGYADAFVQAFRDRGRTVSRPSTSEIAALGKLCRDHALDRNGIALVGGALPVWIRVQTLAMLDGVEDFVRHRGGASVHGLKSWLDAKGQVAPEPPRDPRPPPEPIDPAVLKAAEKFKGLSPAELERAYQNRGQLCGWEDLDPECQT